MTPAADGASGRSGPAGEAPLAGLPLSGPVRLALSEAARNAPPDAGLTTGRVLEALSRADALGRWDRLWLRTGYPDVLRAADPAGEAGADGCWDGVRLSPALDASLRLLAHLARWYAMDPVQPGVLALALLADPVGGASQAMLAGSGLSHGALLAMVQEELLGSELADLDRALDAAGPEGPGHATAQAPDRAAEREDRPERAAPAGRQQDDVGLLPALLAESALEHLPAVELPDDLVDAVRPLGVRSAADIEAAARTEFATAHPTPWQMLFSLAERPSPAAAALLSVTGTTGPQLAVETRLGWEKGQRGRGDHSVAVGLLSLVQTVFLMAQGVLVFRQAGRDGNWWELAFIAPAMYSSTPLASTLLGAVPLYFLLGPLSAGLKLVDMLFDWAGTRAKRRNLWARTGVRLSLREAEAFERRHSPTGKAIRNRAELLAPLRTSLLLRRLRRRGRSPAPDEGGTG